MKTHSNIYILLFLSTQFLSGQGNVHFNFWSRLVLQYDHNNKWSTQLEIQHRRQNDASIHSNLLKYNLLNSIRTWLHYECDKKMKISLSPIAIFNHEAVINKKEDISKPSIHEFRATAAVELTQNLVSALSFQLRAGMEFRHFYNQTQEQCRMRYKLGLKYGMNSRWQFLVYEEVFSPISDLDHSFLFDQNRTALLMVYRLTEHSKLETGYMYVNRVNQNTSNISIDHNILVHLYYNFPKNEVLDAEKSITHLYKS